MSNRSHHQLRYAILLQFNWARFAVIFMDNSLTFSSSFLSEASAQKQNTCSWETLSIEDCTASSVSCCFLHSRSDIQTGCFWSEEITKADKLHKSMDFTTNACESMVLPMYGDIVAMYLTI